MAQQPFKWPNNARIAFVLGIAFEAWDRSKPSSGGALQSSAAGQCPLQMRLLYGNIS